MADLGQLTATLSDPDADKRRQAAWYLGNLGPAAAGAVPALVRAFEDSEVRTNAEWALSRVGPPAVPALCDALRHPESSVRAAAIRTLRKIAVGSGDLVPLALAKARSDPEAGIRELAARSLGEIGRSASFTAPALIHLTSDPVYAVRQSAAEALGRIADVEPRTLRALVHLLDDSNREVRYAAASGLVTLGQRDRSPYFRGAVSRLEQLARQGSAEDRALFRSAAAALRASLPARRSWPFRNPKEVDPSESLPRPADPPEIDARNLPRVDLEED